MKRKISIIISALVITLLLFSCFYRNKEKAIFVPVEKHDRSIYTIECELDPEGKTLSGELELNYYNNDDIEMGEIYFHVYPNAFKSKETAPFLFDDFDNAYKRGFEPGYAEILSVIKEDDNGEKLLEHSFSGAGETIMKVELDTPLKPYGRIDLRISFKLQIPPASERFGYGDKNFNLGNWYPIVAVYDDKDGWNLDKYYAIGDPFYSDAADYFVSIKAPREYIIAASGKNTEKKVSGGGIIWVFEEVAMRDFAFVASTDFKIIEEKYDGVNIKSYYYSGDEKKGKLALESGVKAIKLFNKIFGKYPYQEYSIVETEFPSGMEYPALVYISDKLYKDDYGNDPLIITVVHETAHQWFYGIVGNDQIDEPWLDEGFASYGETLYAESVYGKKTGKEYFQRTVTDSMEEALSSNIIDGSLSKSLKDFENWQDYGPTAYDRGAQMLHDLREMLGDDNFYKILRTYVERYKFKIAYKEDFIKVCEEISGKDLTEFFNEWF